MMKAGKQLDALIAERIMGLLVRPAHDMEFTSEREWAYEGNFVITSPEGYSPSLCPSFSTDIAAAWQVIEKLTDYDPQLTQWGYEDGSVGWMCDFEGTEAHAPTVALAICLAALKVIDGARVIED